MCVKFLVIQKPAHVDNYHVGCIFIYCSVPYPIPKRPKFTQYTTHIPYPNLCSYYSPTTYSNSTLTKTELYTHTQTGLNLADVIKLYISVVSWLCHRVACDTGLTFYKCLDMGQDPVVLPLHLAVTHLAP